MTKGVESRVEYQVFRVFTFHVENSSSFFSLREWMASVLRWIRLFRDFGELIVSE